jgi:hypothetical protein
MTTPQVKIVNTETGEEVIRDMDVAELAQWELNKAAAQADKDAIAAKAADKAALLERLGITAEEAKLLLG